MQAVAKLASDSESEDEEEGAEGDADKSDEETQEQDEEELEEATSCAEPAEVKDCPYCLSNTKHPLFVYLLRVHGLDNFTAHVGVTRNPLKRLQEHNRVPGFRQGPKSTQRYAPNLRLWMIVGPFSKGAEDFRNKWRHGSRTSTKRYLYGYKLAKLHKAQHPQIKVYVEDVKEFEKLQVSL